MTDILKYNLPDYAIYESAKSDFRLWKPDRNIIVLGAANKPEDALCFENILEDNIEIYKRPSGGQAVVLTPKTLVIAVIRIHTIQQAPKTFFSEINSIIIQSLSQLGVENLYHKGISDIAIGEKKILGSSMYRNKEKHFYHAVLNIAESPELFERYLKHPIKEPDYRKGRSHSDFVTSLQKEGYAINADDIISAFSSLVKSAGLDL